MVIIKHLSVSLNIYLYVYSMALTMALLSLITTGSLRIHSSTNTGELMKMAPTTQLLKARTRDLPLSSQLLLLED